MSIDSLISSMNFSEINELIQKLQHAQVKKKKTIVPNYGEIFCKIIGEETLCNLPEVSAKSLNLQVKNKYPQGIVKPSMLGDTSAVRGILSWERPFIAVKIEAKEVETQKIVGVFVEVIFKRYTDSYPNLYVTALGNTSDEGEKVSSFLYSSGGMNEEQMQAVKDLLDGKEILDPLRGRYLLKKVS
jgi:hypothetical protein